MKKLFPLSFTFLLITLTVISCKKTEYNNDWAEQRRLDSLNKVRIDALLEEQAPILEAYAKEHIGEDVELDESSGIWYKIHQPGIEGSFEYRLIGVTGGVTLSPVGAEVKYFGKLVANGTIFDQTSEDDEEDLTRELNLGTLIPAWRWAFLPTEADLNGHVYKLGGFTENGLQKGAIIEFVTPSPWAYDNRELRDDGELVVPADSPLHFRIEIVDLKHK